jgi:glycerol-3-phosphate acyltransferase PlsY
MTGPNLPVALGLLIPAAYLAGSIPFGLLVGKAKGIDVRTAGSKNIGASNVGRLLGRKFFWIVFFLDACKGLLPTLAATVIVRSARGPTTSAVYGLWMAVGLAAIVGHMFSLFLRFRGGKGVATTAGSLLGVWPFLTLPCVVMVTVFAILFRWTRYISVGSMAGAITFPVSYIVFGLTLGWDPFGRQWPFTAFSLLVAGLVVFKHRTNIARLRAGTENRANGRE